MARRGDAMIARACRRLVPGAALLLAVPSPAGASCTCPQISRSKIITTAASGVGCPYVWGGSCWDPNKKSWAGADCSGFAGKCWEVPKYTPVTQCGYHPYSTYNFYHQTTHWASVSWSSLAKGDAMVRHNSSGQHIVIFVSMSKWGYPETYEAKGSAYGIVHNVRYTGTDYKGIQRHNLASDGPPDLDATYTGQGATSVYSGTGGAYYSVCPGQKFSFHFQVKNSGGKAWTDTSQLVTGKAVRLGHQGGDTFGNSTRISVASSMSSDSDVQPGESVTFTMPGAAPSTAGLYKTEWQMVSEMVAWFGPKMWLSFDVTSTPSGHGKTCSTGLQGVCASGTQTCGTGGAGLVCTPVTAASAEVCDGKDNDCDGSIDEGVCTSAPDSGAAAGPDSSTPGNPDPPASDGGPWSLLDQGATPPLLPAEPARELQGSCALGGGRGPGGGCVILLVVLGLLVRGRATSRARRGSRAG